MIDWTSWIGTIVAIGIAVAIALAAVLGLRLLASLLSRKLKWMRELDRRVRRAWSAFCLVIAVWIAGAVSQPGREDWWPAVSHLLLIAAILTAAWLLAALVSFGFEGLLTRETVTFTGANLRRRRTQLLVIQRLTLVLIGVVAVGTVLFSFPALRIVGTSLLASAGIVSVIAGLAAQSIFGNLIAGIQIAFTDAIRVGDVVVIEGEWGRIGEINLSYVVVYIWDERRLVIPCSYFTTNPIETWTRKSDAILGTVYMDLDWRVPMDEVRAKFQEIIEASDAWDRRSSSVYVTDSQGGHVTVRFVMSSEDSDAQWVLRCEVREKMMTWLQQEHPEALPRTRIAVDS
ncbi:mechanosensitive ion channel domain-containing protein [Microbacterium sp. H1-D42]|uniref:mechanosensitive ion channel family protein n=1 Tax=Microbacterium sp. H1-D42 TaxID=2925844 RepID=UPI001F535F15|nr:mechanosensitive ion channel domain-containing protein [Microbacterium sp. H1-D42]UNK70655.1 mechanosensitive ion channel family protein [Microbacterium sp. H1-D42]